VLILSRSEIERLLPAAEYDDLVAAAFRARAERRAMATGLLHADAEQGEFHVKTGGWAVAGRSYFGLKANGGFFGNPSRNGLPAIQGVIYLADAATGAPLALLDSMAITWHRTGAATAVAVRLLARADAHVATICGAGTQGRIQLHALARARRLTAAYVWSRNDRRARELAHEMTTELGIPVLATHDLRGATLSSDLIATCTPATRAYLSLADIRPGTFIAAIGADSPMKQELDPRLVASSVVVADIAEQSAVVGEVHHAIAAGYMTRDDIRVELGELIAGQQLAHRRDDDIVIFDSTGTALQDVAAAAAVYERALAEGVGHHVALDR
jgi:alanine dehydrogenase